ncbi:hypothetical protein CDD83_7393 [Cordyceps sp. RAO-2017]|nr:hypothetical protein CDD83_7393 [Cordyceps sp. RAO-2017]
MTPRPLIFPAEAIYISHSPGAVRVISGEAVETNTHLDPCRRVIGGDSGHSVAMAGHLLGLSRTPPPLLSLLALIGPALVVFIGRIPSAASAASSSWGATDGPLSLVDDQTGDSENAPSSKTSIGRTA